MIQMDKYIVYLLQWQKIKRPRLLLAVDVTQMCGRKRFSRMMTVCKWSQR